MKKVFLGHPMAGLSDDEILEVRAGAYQWALENIGPDIEIIDSFLDLGLVHPLIYIAKSIELLAQADIILVLPGWEMSKGCKIEVECALLYGKHDIIFMKD